MNRRGPLTFLTLLLLWALIAQVNHYLAVWHLYIFVGALFVTLAALRLPLSEGLFATVLGGLLCDANAPVPFGTHVLLFTLTHILIHKIHPRVPSTQTVPQVIIALVANLSLYLALTIILAAGPNHRMPGLGRWGIDLLVSQLFLVLIAPWFFALQTSLLKLDPIRNRRRF